MALVCLLALLLGEGPKLEDLKKSYMDALKQSKWGEVRAQSRAIAETGRSSALAFLNDELRLAGGDTHKRALFGAIAVMKRPEVVRFLETHANSGDPFFRAHAVKGLVAHKPKESFKLAVNMYDADDDPRVRRVAIETLASYKSEQAAAALIEGAADIPADEQQRVVHALSGFEDEVLATAAFNVLKRGKPESQLVAMIAISGRTSEKFAVVLNHGRQAKDWRVKLVAAAGLERTKTPGQSSSLRAMVKKAKSFDALWELYDLIDRARLRDKILIESLMKGCTGGKTLLRPKAAQTYGRVAGADAVPLLTKCLRATKPWQLPIGAARGLANTRQKDAVEPLIAAMERAERDKAQKSRLALELSLALESLTGQPFGLRADLWRRWWKERGAGFTVRELQDPLWEEETANADEYAFYGVSVRSQRVAFVCDVSGSMEGSKLDTLKTELTRFLKRFSENGRFNLIFFNEKVAPWKKKLVPCKPKARAAALSHIDGLAAAGATNLWDALQLAMLDKSVDTILLLSDGSPTAGKLQALPKIRDQFTIQNRARMVLVHVIAIEQDPRELRELAHASGGSYVTR